MIPQIGLSVLYETQMIQDDTGWFGMVPCGTMLLFLIVLFKAQMVQDGSGLARTVQDGARWWQVIPSGDIRWC